MTEPTSAEPAAPSLAELYTRDPLTLTRDDPAIAQIVDALRLQRANFNEAEGRGERPSRAKKPPKAKADLDTLVLDL